MEYLIGAGIGLCRLIDSFSGPITRINSSLVMDNSGGELLFGLLVEPVLV